MRPGVRLAAFGRGARLPGHEACGNASVSVGVMIRVIALGTVVLSSAACDGPCRALAEQICACEPSARERRACSVRVENADARQDPTPEEQSICSGLLDRCTCDALAQDNLAACGLTKGRER